MLFELLEKLAMLKILEKHENDKTLYRWNVEYDWESL